MTDAVRTYPLTTVRIVMYDEIAHMPQYSTEAEFPDKPTLFAMACVPVWPDSITWPITWVLLGERPGTCPIKGL